MYNGQDYFTNRKAVQVMRKNLFGNMMTKKEVFALGITPNQLNRWEKLKKIARMWYEDGLIAQAIAAEFGVTRQRINKIEQEIREKFRHFIGAYENFCFLKAEREENEYRKN